MIDETANKASIPSLFADASFWTRTFIWLRWRLTPYQRIASSLPAKGRILDLGSGHGLLSIALAMSSNQRDVIGIDHDRNRVRLAESAAERQHGIPKLRFEVGPLEQKLATFPPASLAGVAMIDILHYFDAHAQQGLLQNAARVLEPGGTLAVREVDSAGGVTARWNRFYENVATGVGFTRSVQPRLEFRSAAGWTALLESAGFEVRSESCGSPIFSDVLFIGRRPL
jgi:ubiquinone/menaquinone biosynthesis C-methylase UbiE